jgi:hypothetical protein
MRDISAGSDSNHLKGDFMRDNNSEHRQRKMSQTTQADALVKGAAFGKCNTGLIHIRDESLKNAC